mmetsp:Transcript_6046/g.13900  ORF Transcript_6046/g.13900 Transcript_6046/m.13900 type:complete len:217 (+) Transcript_6046:165-815(+)
MQLIPLQRDGIIALKGGDKIACIHFARIKNNTVIFKIQVLFLLSHPFIVVANIWIVWPPLPGNFNIVHMTPPRKCVIRRFSTQRPTPKSYNQILMIGLGSIGSSPAINELHTVLIPHGFPFIIQTNSIHAKTRWVRVKPRQDFLKNILCTFPRFLIEEGLLRHTVLYIAEQNIHSAEPVIQHLWSRRMAIDTALKDSVIVVHHCLDFLVRLALSPH